ncbi:hypothetical protein QIH91_16980 [Bradyrhizobium japonicum USDA 135]|nr:hypothetical protein QIH91_16980 [Bradyrhizobium japonicum USDA 135]
MATISTATGEPTADASGCRRSSFLPVTDWTKASVCAISASRSLIHFMIHLSHDHSSKAAASSQEGSKGIAYFSRSPDIERMVAGEERSDEAEGLRLIRAFLSLPPDKRAEVIAFAEELARAHALSAEGREASPR